MKVDELTSDQKAMLSLVHGRIPATAQELAAGLIWLSMEMNKVGEELDTAEEEAGELIEAHGRLYDQEFLKAAFDPNDPSRRVTEEIRKALARTATWEKRLEMEAAKRKVKRIERQLNRLDRRSYIRQSIGKALALEVRTIGYGQHGV